MISTPVAVNPTKTVLFWALLAPAFALAAGFGALGFTNKGFQAGKYSNRTATIASISASELRHASKAENIEGLLALARSERLSRLDEIASLQAWDKFNRIASGDRLLLRCLKEPGCEPLSYADSITARFASIKDSRRLLARCLDETQCDPLSCADVAKVSELHHQVMLRQPSRSLVQANHAVGDISEQVMHRHFESTGWQRIDGQIGRSGIDGLFIKRNSQGHVREVLIAESKVNTSALQNTNHGEQMSRQWVQRKLQQLREQDPEDPTYRKVSELIDRGFYRARLWTMRVEDGQIRLNLQRLRSETDKVNERLDDPGTRVVAPPEVIDIAAPKDSLERTIVSAYTVALNRLGPAP